MLLSLERKSEQQFTSGPRLSFTLFLVYCILCLSFVLWFFHLHKSLLAKKWTALQPKLFLPYLNTARDQNEGWWFRGIVLFFSLSLISCVSKPRDLPRCCGRFPLCTCPKLTWGRLLIDTQATLTTLYTLLGVSSSIPASSRKTPCPLWTLGSKVSSVPLKQHHFGMEIRSLVLQETLSLGNGSKIYRV